MKKALIVLGAGASYDVWDENSPRLPNPNVSSLPDAEHHLHTWRPPVAQELFDFAARPDFFTEIAQHYQGAKNLGLQLASRSESEAIEAALREYADHPHPRRKRWFRDIPAYLRDLLYACTHKYVRLPANYITLFDRLIHDSNHEIALVILNYDTLAELALAQFGCRFRGLDDYINQAAGVGPVIKMHGSTNWFVPIGRGSWGKCVDNLDLDGIDKAQIQVIDEVEGRVRDYSPEGVFWYPVLTAPMAGKDEDEFVCPDAHLDALAEWAMDCSKVLIIGASGLDADLLRLLSGVLESPLRRHKGRKLEAVQYVGGKKAAACRTRFSNSVSSLGEHLGATLKTGFCRYVQGRGGHFDAFLAK